MDWFLITIMGATMGAVAGFFAQTVGMPSALTIALGAIGALLGGTLFTIVKFPLFGEPSFYFYGVVMAIGLLAGGALAFNLTSRETRI
jgi:uncharacterized membrane protein YeaQ/YmgE (transglycosylase-associated protein family)